MTSDKEQYRFKATNEAILEIVGPINTLLEFGCGEGHQSSALLQLTPNLTGIDVSPIAIKRAIERCPTAYFQVSHGLKNLEPPEGKQFTLVTACEVLYYVKDVSSVLSEMQTIAEWCLVTYYEKHATVLDPFFAGIAHKQTREITYEDTTWILHCWKNQ